MCVYIYVYIIYFLFRPGLWHKAKKVVLTAGQTDVKASFLKIVWSLNFKWLLIWIWRTAVNLSMSPMPDAFNSTVKIAMWGFLDYIRFF